METTKGPDLRFSTPDFTPPTDMNETRPKPESSVPEYNSTDSSTLPEDIPAEDLPDLFTPLYQEEDNESPTGDMECDIIITPPLSDEDGAAIMSKLDALMEKFDARLARDEHKDALFDKMYGELASYKNDLYAKLLKPFILSAVSLLDDTNGFIEKLNADGENPDPEKMRRFISNLPLDIEDMLEVNGVEIYNDGCEIFNPSTQRVAKTIPTSNPDDDKRIIERLRRGYRWNGTVLRPEMVSIYKYKQ